MGWVVGRVARYRWGRTVLGAAALLPACAPLGAAVDVAVPEDTADAPVGAVEEPPLGPCAVRVVGELDQVPFAWPEIAAFPYDMDGDGRKDPLQVSGERRPDWWAKRAKLVPWPDLDVDSPDFHGVMVNPSQGYPVHAFQWVGLGRGQATDALLWGTYASDGYLLGFEIDRVGIVANAAVNVRTGVDPRGQVDHPMYILGVQYAAGGGAS